MKNLEIALSYLNKGLSVIPLWSPKELKNNPPFYLKEIIDKAAKDNSDSDNPLPKKMS